jgi:hypothetical protein
MVSSDLVIRGLPKTDEERKALRAQRMEAMRRMRLLHKAILARRGGVPIDVDSVIDELRGHCD